MQTILQQSNFIGPATVDRSEAGRVLLRVNDAQVWAIPALAYSYSFECEDTVLVIGQNDDWYVIGVLKGRGKTSFHVQGDLQFVSTQGSIDLIAPKGISIKSNRITLMASQLSILAKRLSQRLQSLRTNVKNGVTLVAARVSNTVSGSHRLKAGKIVERADGDVKIDGRKIHLG